MKPDRIVQQLFERCRPGSGPFGVAGFAAARDAASAILIALKHQITVR